MPVLAFFTRATRSIRKYVFTGVSPYSVFKDRCADGDAQLTEIEGLCIILHMLTVVVTDVFSAWLARLKDVKGRARIAARVERVRLTGNFGDTRSLGNGVSELRIDYGPGYRLYFTRRGEEIVILLCAGDKGSQDRDIRTAVRMAEDYR